MVQALVLVLGAVLWPVAVAWPPSRNATTAGRRRTRRDPPTDQPTVSSSLLISAGARRDTITAAVTKMIAASQRV